MRELEEAPAKLAAMFDVSSNQAPTRIFTKRRVFGRAPFKPKAKLVILISLGFTLISVHFIAFV